MNTFPLKSVFQWKMLRSFFRRKILKSLLGCSVLVLWSEHRTESTQVMPWENMDITYQNKMQTKHRTRKGWEFSFCYQSMHHIRTTQQSLSIDNPLFYLCNGYVLFSRKLIRTTCHVMPHTCLRASTRKWLGHMFSMG